MNGIISQGYRDTLTTSSSSSGGNTAPADYAIPYTSGSVLYVIIHDQTGAEVYNFRTLAFETYNEANQPYYAQTLTDEGGGWYVGYFPQSIPAGTYYINAFLQSGDVPDSDDPIASAAIDIEWNGTAVVHPPRWTDLITLDYAKAVCNIPSGTTTYDDLITQLIHAASGKAKSYCRRGFVSQQYSEIYDLPRPTRSIVLRQFPVFVVTALTIRPRGRTPVKVDPSTLYVDQRTGQLSFLTDCFGEGFNFFPEGMGAVAVTYIAGYTTVPESVQDAVANMVKQMFDRNGNDYTLMMEQIGGTNQYKRQNFSPDISVIMTKDVRDGLDPYRDLGV